MAPAPSRMLPVAGAMLLVAAFAFQRWLKQRYVLPPSPCVRILHILLHVLFCIEYAEFGGEVRASMLNGCSSNSATMVRAAAGKGRGMSTMSAIV
jgi:hypothetical protein